MGNQAGIIIRNVKNELFHSAKRLILNEVKGIECLHSKHRKDYPAVKIGRLGVSKLYQKTGDSWGTKILDFIKHWMVSENKSTGEEPKYFFAL